MKNCNSCGRCCEYAGNGGLSATAEEIEHWQIYHPEIARLVQNGKIWVDPSTGNYFNRCPWLRHVPTNNTYTCDIYEFRPEDCRHYPVDIAQMRRDNCEMLEPKDLKNISNAQKKLDAIMIDSRPPVIRR